MTIHGITAAVRGRFANWSVGSPKRTTTHYECNRCYQSVRSCLSDSEAACISPAFHTDIAGFLRFRHRLSADKSKASQRRRASCALVAHA